MIKRCTGCGALLQDADQAGIGYTRDLSLPHCERCFRIEHYNDYQVVEKDNEEYLNILKKINKTNDLVVFVIDLFNLNDEVYELAKKIHNPCLLVLTKRDLFAEDIYNEKFTTYLKSLPVDIVDQVLISSKNNFGFDELYDKIRIYQKSKNVYVIGLTNAGKSTMINQLFHHYSEHDSHITTSNLPSTTIDMMTLPFSDSLTIIDTPGILDHSMTNVISSTLLKSITPKVAIKPITYQIKTDQSIMVGEYVRIDVKKGNSVTLYFANQLEKTRYYKDHDRLKNLEKYEFHVPWNHDILIAGFGFIKVVEECDIILYTIPGVEVSIRKALI